MLFWAAFAALCYFVYAQNKWIFYGLLAVLAILFAYTFTKLKYKIAFFATALLLVGVLWLTVNYTPFQNWLVQKVTTRLSNDLNTTVSIKHVDYKLFNKMEMEGVLIKDLKKDTLLYAATAKVNITDWFFFKDKATLHYIGLSNAVVNLNRTDSVWNYKFFIDYFDGGKSTGKKKKSMELDLQTVELENIRFVQKDDWIGKSLQATIGKLNLNAKAIDFTKKIIDIDTIDFNNLIFAQADYDGNREKLGIISTSSPKNIDTTQKYKWNNDGWIISVKNINIKNGIFKVDRQTERPIFADKFDGQHILFTEINGSLKNILFTNDTLTTDINLATKERIGFQVKKLQANLKVTPEMMEFNNLDLITNKSKLGNYYAMWYNSISDMQNFIHAVTLDGKFENSILHSDDLAFFAPNLKTWNRIFDLKGFAKGTVDNLSAKKMLIKSGNTIVDGDIALRGLPDITTTFIDFKSNDFRTTYGDLVTIIPALKKVTQPQLSKLGNIQFKGNYTGFINDFVAYGNINTNLGLITADINMKLPSGKPALYSGKISSTAFNLGSFLNNKQLGNISLNGNVKGSGFNAKDVDLNFDGQIKQIHFANYNYQNAIVKGNLNKKLFKGNLAINDPNVVITNLDGTINLNDALPQFVVDADVKKANLKKLGFTKDDFEIGGNFSLNFKGTNLDNFKGTADINNAFLKNNGNPLSLNNLHLSSTVSNGVKLLDFSTNEFNGSINGVFNLQQLPDAFSLLLNKYYPSYFKRPTRNLGNQDFSFNLKTNNVEEYVQLLDKRLKGFNNSTFTGRLKTPGDELNLIADIPQFSYDGKTFVNTHLQAIGSTDTLATIIDVGDIAISDSLHFPQSKLTLSSTHDLTNIQLVTSANKTLGDAFLNASVQTLSDGVKIHFFPSSFMLNDKKWNLEKDGELEIRRSFISATEIKFTQGNQEIVIGTAENTITGKPDIVAQLKNVSISDIGPFVKNLPNIDGLLNGKLTLENPFGKPFIEYEGDVNDFVFEGKKIGKVKVKGDVNTVTGLIRYNASTDEKDYKFNVDGTYNLKDSTGNALALAFTSDRMDVGILTPYLSTVFNNMKGNAVSDLKIYGNKILGTVNITDGSFNVAYTNCTYKFSNETILFNPDEIDLGTLALKDTLNNNATASGKMYHKFFKEFEFDNIKFESDRLLLLNTSKKDNAQFYGKVIGKAKMSIDGPVTNLKMDIDGEPSYRENDSNHIYIPSSKSKENGAIDYIEFTQFGTKMEDLGKLKEGTTILVNMALTANPACKIDVILDEETKDIISGRGNGLLNIRVGNKEPLTIRGRYNITGGEYTFNFQTFLKKYFSVSGGTIDWNGDPFLANIDIKANYLAKNVDVSSITSSRGFKQKEDVTIVSHITGLLKNPEIGFEFTLPPNSEIANDFIAKKKLQDFQTDKNEMYKQVASLLLFNTFISNTQDFINRSSTISLATNTIGGIVSGWLTNLFNRELERATNGVLSTYVDLNTTVDLQQQAKQLQANVRAGLKILLSNRLQILVGGNLDYNNPYAQLAKRGLLTPDISIQWLLNKDGSLRVVGFNRTSTDLTLGQRNRSGVSLTYRKDFDKLSDLFKRSQEKKDRKKAQKEKKAAEAEKKRLAELDKSKS